MMRGMVINMEEVKLQTLVQIKAFLDGTTEVDFRVPKAERYAFIERVLKRIGYALPWSFWPWRVAALYRAYDMACHASKSQD